MVSFSKTSLKSKNIYDDFFMSTDKSVCLALSRTEYLDEKTQWIDKIAWENGAAPTVGPKT